MNTMDCHQVREQLNAFLDHELGEFENRQVAAHVEECPSCRHELDAYRSTRDFMHQYGAVPSPPNMAENIRIIMEKERLIPRRSKARSLFTASRASTVGRFALAATFLLAILGGGSYYIFDTIGDHQKITTHKAAQTSARAELQTPAATAAREYARGLEEKSPTEPETLSLNSLDDEALPDADESSEGLSGESHAAQDQPTARSAQETAVARSMPAQPATPAQPSSNTFRGRAPKPRESVRVNSLDIMVEETLALARTASGAGPGSLPAIADGASAPKARSLKPFSELSGVGGAAGEKRLADSEKSDDALSGLSWSVASRSLPASAAASPSASATMADKPSASKPAPASSKNTKKDTKEKKKLPALSIILKARSGQPLVQQQAMMKQLQPLLDSGAAQMQNGKVVLNMPADETLKLLQSINADPSNVAPVPVPEKMLQNEISSKEPRLVNTEIIFMPNEAKPAEPAAEADEPSGDSE
jgi:hypothetical protein